MIGCDDGTLVEAVDTILRLDWSQMRVPPEMMTSRMGGLVTAVTELPDKRLIMMLDVEKVLSETARIDDEYLFKDIPPVQSEEATVFYADDSTVARKQIERTLQQIGVKAIGAINGRAAWDELQRIAQHAEASGKKVSEMITTILTDIEMPEMDGYILTKMIKSDPRFEGIPVLMHSSLSGMSNQSLGKSVGVDAYVSKFEPRRLADTLRAYIDRTPDGVTAA